MKLLMMAATITLFAASGAFAADETWTGKISDSTCGLSHKAAIEHGGGKMTNAQCTAACMKSGAKYVFTSGGIVYAIVNQDDKDLAFHAGKAVQLTGEKHGTTIIVSKVVKRPKKRA